MSWYQTGTVTVTNGSGTVTGAGTAWLANANEGDLFTLDRDKFYKITAVAGDGTLTISPDWAGSTASGQSYSIIQIYLTNAQLSARLAELTRKWQLRENELVDWLAGTVDGGPNNNGTYPLTDVEGNTIYVRCPAWITAVIGDPAITTATEIIEALQGAYDLVEPLSDEILALHAIIPDITAVAAIAASITAVNGISANIATVAGIAANVTTVAGLSSSIPTVAGIAANITSVAGMSSNISVVSGIASNITTVAGISADVSSVASQSASVAAVAAIDDDVVIVSAVASEVATVAGIASDVTNAPTHAAEAKEAVSAVAFRFTFDNGTTMANPGTGEVRGNNAAIASITQLAISASAADTGNPDISSFMVTWDDSTHTPSGILTLRKKGAPGTFVTLGVNGTITDNGAWLQIPVSYIAHSGTLSDGDTLFLTFVGAGNDGTGVGDMLAANNLAELTSPGVARSNLGLVIGSDVQAYSAKLSALASLTWAANKILLFTGAGSVSTADYTSAGLTLLSAADASAQRTALGLGALATKGAVNNTDWSGTPLSIANGGTGGTDVASILSSLGIVGRAMVAAIACGR